MGAARGPALCGGRCCSTCGQQGAGLATTLLLPFPGSRGPHPLRGMRVILIRSLGLKATPQGLLELQAFPQPHTFTLVSRGTHP